MNRKNYSAWKLDETEFSNFQSESEKFKFFSRFGILAPSTHNTQPWKIQSNDQGLDIKVDNRRSLRQADPNGNHQFISLGACIENIALVAENFGYKTSVLINNEKEFNLEFEKISENKNGIKPATIINRFSDKRPYKSKKVASRTLENIQKLLHDFKDLQCVFIQTPETFNELLLIHLEASKRTVNDKKFVRELSHWLKPNNTRSNYGMPGFVMGVSRMKSNLGPTLFRINPKIFKKMTKSEKKLLEKSAGFFLIASASSDLRTIIDVGRAYQRTSLLLRQAGIASSPLAALVNYSDLNMDAAETAKIRGEVRLFMRFGYPIDGEIIHTPRAPL